MKIMISESVVQVLVVPVQALHLAALRLLKLLEQVPQSLVEQAITLA